MQSEWSSDDGGQHWKRLLTPTGGIYNETRCWAVRMQPDRAGEVLAGTHHGLYRYREETGRFDYIPSPMDSLHILQIARYSRDPGFILCGTRPGEVFISQNDRENWSHRNFDAST